MGEGQVKADKAQRLAAGYACLNLFAVCNTIAHGLRTISATHIDDTGLGRGLSEQERKYVMQLSLTFHEHAETLRKLGWRFLGKTHGRPIPPQSKVK